MDRATVTGLIAKTLAPYLGATTAEASTRAHCEKLGINGQSMSDAQLQALLGKLGGGLAVFVGREKATGVVEEIRRTVGAVGEPR